MAGSILGEPCLEDKARNGVLPSELTFDQISSLWAQAYDGKGRRYLDGSHRKAYSDNKRKYAAAMRKGYQDWLNGSDIGLEAAGNLYIEKQRDIHPSRFESQWTDRDRLHYGRPYTVKDKIDNSLNCTATRESFYRWILANDELELISRDCLLFYWLKPLVKIELPDAQNSETYPLQSKDFYYLEATAERWTKLCNETITVGDILDWKAKGMLSLCEVDLNAYREGGTGVKPGNMEWAVQSATILSAMKMTGNLKEGRDGNIRLVISHTERDRFELNLQARMAQTGLTETMPLSCVANDASDAEEEETQSQPREMTRWLKEIWKKENKPGGTALFNALKKHKGQKGSPITDWFSSGKDAGVQWTTSSGASGQWSKKMIQNKASEFKKDLSKGCQPRQTTKSPG